MNLKEKLARLEKSIEKEFKPIHQEIVSDEWIRTFENELKAKILTEKNSFIIFKENIYPLYKDFNLDSRNENVYIFSKIGQIAGLPELDSLNLRECLFIDLETTGLAGGTGTYAFLIGVGHVELDHIIVRQYVLPDFQHEWLALKHLQNALLGYKYLISFNGKTYDIPLLRNRFILNRMVPNVDDLVHIDILHIARRIWKRRLQTCDLQNLEYAILGRGRLNDIPGALIPQIYFEYIRKREALLLRDVLEHNYHDIVNMIILTIKIGELVQSPLKKFVHPEDLFSIAKYYYNQKNFKEAIPILQYLAQTMPDTISGKESTFLLAMAKKRTGNSHQASHYMHQLLQSEKDHPLAIMELAKIYEHREKDLHSALEVVNQGLKYIDFYEQLGKASPLVKYKPDLEHRKRRLLRKLKQKNISKNY